MKKGIEWVKNHWFTAGIIAVFLVVVGGIFAALMGWWNIINHEGATSQGDLLRNLILCIGAIGGVYGLHLATERQKTFSHQGFNDRLGRGVELLAKESVVMRCAGIRILVDLLDNSNEKQKSIIVNIIYDFFRSMAIREPNHSDKKYEKEKSHQDVQNALDFLVNLSLDERNKLLPNRLINSRLDFHGLNFGLLEFTEKTLKSIDFCKSCFDGTMFRDCYIDNVNALGVEFVKVNIGDTEIINSNFGHGDIASSNFISTTIMDSTFSSMIIEDANFANVEIINTAFDSVQFIGGYFKGKKKMKVSSRDNLPRFFCTEFRHTEFDFDDEIYSYDFFESCYSPEDQHLPFLNEGEKYKKVLGKGYVFIDGGAWSGESMPKRVAVEITRRKLLNARGLLSISVQTVDLFPDSDKDIKKRKYKVKDLEKKLHAAEVELENDTNKYNPKPKAKASKPKAKKPKPNPKTPK